MDNYQYVFRSGPYKNYPLRHVFFLDPIHVSRFYQKIISGEKNFRTKSSSVPNGAQLAIHDLMEKLKTIKPTKICPICKQVLVCYFLLPDFGVMSEKLICCDETRCKKTLKATRNGQLYKIHKFLSLLSHVKKAEARKIVKIYQKTHENYEEILQGAFA